MDHRGTVLGVVDDDGGVTDYNYNTFGYGLGSLSGDPTVMDRWRYQTNWLQLAGGLSLSPTRTFSCTVGNFLQRDPLFVAPSAVRIDVLTQTINFARLLSPPGISRFYIQHLLSFGNLYALVRTAVLTCDILGLEDYSDGQYPALLDTRTRDIIPFFNGFSSDYIYLESPDDLSNENDESTRYRSQYITPIGEADYELYNPPKFMIIDEQVGKSCDPSECSPSLKVSIDRLAHAGKTAVFSFSIVSKDFLNVTVHWFTCRRFTGKRIIGG